MDTKIVEWLESKAESTQKVYKAAMKKYRAYCTEIGAPTTGVEYLAEINAEATKPLTEQGTIKKRLKQFFFWVTKKEEDGGLGLSENLGATYVGALMGFYRYHNYRVNLRIAAELKPTRKHRRVNLTVKDVRMLCGHAKSMRDRTIILVMAQSGMDVSTVCGLTIQDVWPGLEENEVPIRLHLIRHKENVEYDTFLGKDAIEAVKGYLRQRENEEEALDRAGFLFCLEGKHKGKGKPMKPATIQKFFREIAADTPLTSKEEMQENNWNPVRPHALRRFFADRLRIAGASDTIVDYLQGHKLPYDGAYFGEAFNFYKKAQDVLTIFEGAEDLPELKEGLMKQKERVADLYETIQTQNEQIQAQNERIQTLAAIVHDADFLHNKLVELGLMPPATDLEESATDDDTEESE